MPQLSELVGKKKFVKKEYRPWNLSGAGTVDHAEKSTTPLSNESITPVTQKETVVKEETDNISGNKTGNKQITKRQQRDNIKVTAQKQPSNNEITTREQRDNVTGNDTSNTEGRACLIEGVKKLSGIQKNIFYYVISLCSARSSLDTGNILSSDLAHAASCTIGSAKTSLIRLIEKQLILRLQGKACRGGHMVLAITNEIQAAAIQAQQALFNPLKVTRTDNITGNVTGNPVSYSSSSYKNNTTTSLPESWEKINFIALSHLGFSETQLRQLYDSNATTPEVVQDSIDRFAYSLEYNEKVKVYNDPLNVLMGVLRKGQRWNEPNYVPQKELAMRQMLEDARTRKQQQDIMIKELIDLEFPEWRRKLTPEEIVDIVPFDIRKANISAAILASLRTYFVETILMPRIDQMNSEAGR